MTNNFSFHNFWKFILVQACLQVFIPKKKSNWSTEFVCFSWKHANSRHWRSRCKQNSNFALSQLCNLTSGFWCDKISSCVLLLKNFNQPCDKSKKQTNKQLSSFQPDIHQKSFTKGRLQSSQVLNGLLCLEQHLGNYHEYLAHWMMMKKHVRPVSLKPQKL